MFIIQFIKNFDLYSYDTTLDYAKSWGIGFQDPATPIMEGIIGLHHDIFFILIMIVVFVSWMLFSAVHYFGENSTSNINKNKISDHFSHHTSLEIIWTIIPSIILIIIAIPSFALLYAMDEVHNPMVTIKAIGHQWYWSYECHYIGFLVNVNNKVLTNDPYSFDSYMVQEEDLNFDKGELRLLTTDNALVLPAFSHIRIIVTSTDVLHSWAVPSLGVKTDACPGRLNQTGAYINRTGTFYGQCSEICGINHGFMPIMVKSVPVLDYFDYISSHHPKIETMGSRLSEALSIAFFIPLFLKRVLPRSIAATTGVLSLLSFRRNNSVKDAFSHTKSVIDYINLKTDQYVVACLKELLERGHFTNRPDLKLSKEFKTKIVTLIEHMEPNADRYTDKHESLMRQKCLEAINDMFTSLSRAEIYAVEEQLMIHARNKKMAELQEIFGSAEFWEKDVAASVSEYSYNFFSYINDFKITLNENKNELSSFLLNQYTNWIKTQEFIVNIFILPDAILLGGALIGLIYCSLKFGPKRSELIMTKSIEFIISILFLSAGVSAILIFIFPFNSILLFDFLLINQSILFAKSILFILGGMVLKMIKEYLKNKSTITGYELPLIVAFSIFGLSVLLSAYEFGLFIISLELASFSFYTLAALGKQNIFSAEASLKYLLLGAVASCFILLGTIFVYLKTGFLNFNDWKLIFFDRYGSDSSTLSNLLITGLGLIVIGLLFKVGAAPLHSWLPDTYEGSPLVITAFFATVAKLSMFIVFLRIYSDTFSTIFYLFDYGKYIIAIFAFFSMLVGSLGGIYQKQIKRLFAYSSISHVGYSLIGIYCSNISGYSASMLYMYIYTLTTLGIFAFLLSFFSKKNGSDLRYITDLKGLHSKNMNGSLYFSGLLLSLSGIPPFIGFFGKAFVFESALQTGDTIAYLLVVMGIFSSVISTYYYLRLIKIIFFEEPLNEDYSFTPSTLNGNVLKFAFYFSVLSAVGVPILIYLTDLFVIRLSFPFH